MLLDDIHTTSVRDTGSLVTSPTHCSDTQETLAVLDTLDPDPAKASDEEIMRKFGWEEQYYNGQITAWMRLFMMHCDIGCCCRVKPFIWMLFDEPYSSRTAKVTPIMHY